MATGKKAAATAATENKTANASAKDTNAPAAAANPNVRTVKTVVEGNPIVKIDGKEYEVKTPLFEVSGFGRFTNKEAATNEKLIRHLLEMGSSVLKEVF